MSVKYTDILTRHDRAKAETRKTHIPSNLQPAEQSNSVKLNLNTRQTTKRKQSIIQIHLWSCSCSESQSLCARLFPPRPKIYPMCLWKLPGKQDAVSTSGLVCDLCPFKSLLHPSLLFDLLVSLLPCLAVWKGHIMSNMARESTQAPHKLKPRLTRVGKSPKKPFGTIWQMPTLCRPPESPHETGMPEINASLWFSSYVVNNA